jgi:hypothetical protein
MNVITMLDRMIIVLLDVDGNLIHIHISSICVYIM